MNEAEFLAAGVNQRLAPRRDEQIPQRRQVLHLQRIDDRQPAFRGNLDQAQLGLIAVFGDEFRVEGDDPRRRDDLAEIPQVLVGNDVVVLHAADIQFVA